MNLEIYPGKHLDGLYSQNNSPDHVIKYIVRPIDKAGRNITADNWFSYIPLALDPQKDKLTFVGILRKNKRQLSNNFTVAKGREIISTLFGFQKNCTLISYASKKNKIVLGISTMLYDDAIYTETGDKRKLEIITFYNNTKYGVDVVN